MASIVYRNGKWNDVEMKHETMETSNRPEHHHRAMNLKTGNERERKRRKRNPAETTVMMRIMHINIHFRIPLLLSFHLSLSHSLLCTFILLFFLTAFMVLCLWRRGNERQKAVGRILWRLLLIVENLFYIKQSQRKSLSLSLHRLSSP